MFASVMAAAKAIWDELGDAALAADPWMTTVGYFNAVRELAGMRRMAEDELRTKLRRTRFTTGLANRPTVDLEELTSRVSSDDIKTHPAAPVRHPRPRRAARTTSDPVDLLLATNMISVGVDVPRFGSMIVVGQPKATAEYIQATSRVGRDPRGPGPGDHALQLGPAPRPLALRDVRPLPRHLLPARRTALGHAVLGTGARQGPHRRAGVGRPPRRRRLEPELRPPGHSLDPTRGSLLTSRPSRRGRRR